MTDQDLKDAILEVLDENRIMSLATLRPDGWPQATQVGFIHDDLTLYCGVARASQKLANIVRDPRVSVAIGGDNPERLRGVSLAGYAADVSEVDEILRLNALISERYPERVVFAPREASSAVVRIRPTLISLVDNAVAGGQPQLLSVGHETVVHRLG